MTNYFEVWGYMSKKQKLIATFIFFAGLIISTYLIAVYNPPPGSGMYIG